MASWTRLVIAVLMTACAPEFVEVADAPTTEWLSWGNDPGGARYSQLAQVDRDNVEHLELIWEFHTGETGKGFASASHRTFEATPLVVDELLYLSTPYGKVFALNAATGEERWRHEVELDRSPTYGFAIASRGVSYWEEDRPVGFCDRRVLFGTIDGRLIALDARSGDPCPGFGEGGTVDLTHNVDLQASGNIGITSPPAIYRDVVIVGTSVADFRGVDVEPGIIRAYDIRTGTPRWSWDPIPRDPSDPAWDSWGNESASRAGAGNAWAPLSVDVSRDLVFVPTSASGSSFYGGHRPGRNDYTSSLVALRASSGEVVWHQQLVHHDLWDYDTPAQPVLTEIHRDGRTIPAVVQATKMGLLFLFHRETGDPLFEIEERPVPTIGVPGERPSPTQPFPVAPRPLASHAAVTPEDAWGFTFWDRGRCREQIRRYRSEGIFTPLSTEGTIVVPGFGGGQNWGSVSIDAPTRRVIVNTMDMPWLGRLIPNEKVAELIASGEVEEQELMPQEGTPYTAHVSFLLSPLGVPCTSPPWGTLASVDLDEGRILWQVPLGTVEDLAPAFFPNVRYGVPNIGGSVVTAGGLIFIGAALDDYLRAFDVDTGEELWRARLPAGGQATPMTFATGGRQLIVIAAGGHGSLGSRLGDAVVAYGLPR